MTDFDAHQKTRGGSRSCLAVGCSTPVTLAFNPNTEKNVPLDTRAPVYRVVGFDFDGTPRVEIASGFFVSHFSTCQHADQFSKQRRSK